MTGVDLLAILQPVHSLDHLPAQVVQAPSESQVHRDLELLGVLEDLLDSMSLLMDPQRKPKLDGLGDRVAAILHDVVDYHVAFHDQPRIPDAYNLESEVDREAEHGGIMECLGCGVQPHVCDVVFGSSANQLLQRSIELKPSCAFLECCSDQHAPRLRQSSRSFRRMSCSHCFLLHSSPKHDLQGMQVLEQLADRILDRRLIERLHDLSEGLGINKSFAVALSDIHFLNILAEAQKE